MEGTAVAATNAFLNNGHYLALVYLVISGNYLGNLFGCRVQQAFRESMLLKHLLGFFTAYFLIVLSTPPADMSALQTLGFTALIYAWFFLTTKMHVKLWVPMILSIMVAYGLHMYGRQKDADATKQPDERLVLLKKVTVIAAACLTIVGIALYLGEKKIEYGSDFDVGKFWLGLPECKMQTPPISASESLGALVGLRGFET